MACLPLFRWNTYERGKDIVKTLRIKGQKCCCIKIVSLYFPQVPASILCPKGLIRNGQHNKWWKEENTHNTQHLWAMGRLTHPALPPEQRCMYSRHQNTSDNNNYCYFYLKEQRMEYGEWNNFNHHFMKWKEQRWWLVQGQSVCFKYEQRFKPSFPSPNPSVPAPENMGAGWEIVLYVKGRNKFSQRKHVQ